MVEITIRHYHHYPSNEVPAWVNDLSRKMDLILNKESSIMSQADDLNNAVTALATGYAAEHTAIQAELVAIAAALAGTPNPAITQSIANIQAITAQMATDAQALTASVPAATTVSPPVIAAPVVATAPTVVPPVIATPPVTAPSATPPSTPPASATTTAQ